MVSLNFKTLYANGDSWTAGDIVDPDLFGDDLSKVNDPKNKPYRLPRVWPHKIGKELGIEVKGKIVYIIGQSIIKKKIGWCAGYGCRRGVGWISVMG